MSDVLASLMQEVPLPRVVQVRQRFQAPEISDVPEAVRRSLAESGMLSRLSPGDRVAIAVGSRGVAAIPDIVRETVRAVRAAAAEPFLIPAMGSHGGATAEGQRRVLEQLGVTEEYTGAPIRSSLEVEQIGRLDSGLPVYADRLACQADKVIVINRIKPHTAFEGPVESGLTKMVTIGLGKQKGADAAHRFGFGQMARHVPEMARVVLSRVPVVFGIGTIENAYDRPAFVHVVPAEKLLEVEPELLLTAKSLMPRLLFNPIDVLVVDELGKDISGSGMDPHITGRFPTPFVKGGIDAARVVVLGLTAKTDGNANGLGLADITTRRAFDSIDWSKGFANALTSTVICSVRTPMFLDGDELAVKAGIKTCNAPDLNRVRLVRIKNTLDIEKIWISESLLPEARQHSDIEILTEPEAMIFANN